MDLRKALTVFALAGCLASATSLIAQQTRNQAPQVGTLARGQADRSAWQNADQALATCAAISNQLEIAVVQAAKSKLQDDKVKEFADMLIEDHQAALKKLQRFAPEATRSDSLQDGQESAEREDGSTAKNRVQPAAGTARDANKSGTIQQTSGTQPGQNAQGIDFIQLHREIASECLTQAKKRLSEKDDKEIDACFVGLQIAAHMAMLDKLTVFERHASGELKQVLADASETTQKHLDKAEKLMKDLDQ